MEPVYTELDKDRRQRNIKNEKTTEKDVRVISNPNI
jgi:hypothetical protein